MYENISPEKLRKVQLVQLEILLEFNRICELYNLKYQLFSGTLIGAIRHNGFIPWDDDIDIAMGREDYDKFLKVCNTALKEGFFLQNNITDKNFYRQYSKIRKDNTLYIEAAYRDIDIHHGIYIDIFPLDKVIPNSIVERVRCSILLLLWTLNRIRNAGVHQDAAFLKKAIGFLIHSTTYVINKSSYDNIEKRILTIFRNKKTNYINHLTNKATIERFNRFLIKEDDFFNTITWEFEGYKFPIPYNYHQYLTNIYGDYMKLPPIEQRNPHHEIIELRVN